MAGRSHSSRRLGGHSAHRHGLATGSETTEPCTNARRVSSRPGRTWSPRTRGGRCTRCWCWCCVLAVRVVETGCRCWVPGAGAGVGAVSWLCGEGAGACAGCWLCAWRQGAGRRCFVLAVGRSAGAGELPVHVVETGCRCWAPAVRVVETAGAGAAGAGCCELAAEVLGARCARGAGCWCWVLGAGAGCRELACRCSVLVGVFTLFRFCCVKGCIFPFFVSCLSRLHVLSSHSFSSFVCASVRPLAHTRTFTFNPGLRSPRS